MSLERVFDRSACTCRTMWAAQWPCTHGIQGMTAIDHSQDRH